MKEKIAIAITVTITIIATVIQSININEKVWGKLPENVQKAMIQAGEDIIEPIGQVYDDEQNKFYEEFTANGGIIAELTKEEKLQWDTETIKFTEDWLKKHESDPKYKDVLSAYQAKLDEYK